MKALRQTLDEMARLLGVLSETAVRAFRPRDMEARRILFYGSLPALLVALAAYSLAALYQPPIETFLAPDAPREDAPMPEADLHKPVRDEPRRFRAGAYRPAIREGHASISIRDVAFLPEIDLVHVDDDRVWWESDHDTDDTEDDHLMHRAMEEPLRRLIELVHREGGVLKVQDAYRAEGVHARYSLHKQGRAVDLTCDELGLEKLAKLCWAAGFDWVYNENPKRGGAHVHASVRPDRAIANRD